MEENYKDLLKRLGIEQTQENISKAMQWHADHLTALADDYHGYVTMAMEQVSTTALTLCAEAGAAPFTLYYWRTKFPKVARNVLDIERRVIELKVSELNGELA